MSQLDVTDRFLNEARVTAQLEHPNVVPVYDLGSLPNGQPYYTMRVVKRQSLQDVLASDELRRHWPLVRLVGAFVQISRALAYAHRRGILHRDIKPENILLGDFGEVYLADWGNAKPISSPFDAPIQIIDAPRSRAITSRAGSRARQATSRPSRSAATARRSTTAPISSPSAWCSTRSLPASTPSTRPRSSA